MDLNEEQMRIVRQHAASFVLPPLRDSILRGERDESLAVQTVKTGFVAALKWVAG